jgi:hypothetical protein
MRRKDPLMHRRPRTFRRRLAHGLVGAATVVVAALAVILGVGTWSAAGEQQQSVEPQASTRIETPADTPDVAVDKTAAGRARREQVAEQQRQRAAKAAREASQQRERAARSASRAVSYGDPRRIAASMMSEHYGWGSGEYSCLSSLWGHESGWDVHAENPSSGAYGIPQALPGTKMSSYGSDWQDNPVTQIQWGLSYIDQSYGTPCGALSAWQSKGWY